MIREGAKGETTQDWTDRWTLSIKRRTETSRRPSNSRRKRKRAKPVYSHQDPWSYYSQKISK